MNHLVYLSYGDGPHNLQAQFSILSARRLLCGKCAGCGIVVFTDRPSLFEVPGVEVQLLTECQLEQWSRPHGYIHRRKICLVDHALQLLQTPIAFIDADTYFTKSPLTLFERISPGKTVLHVREGRLAKWNGTRLANSIPPKLPCLALNGEAWPITPDTHMWNSGVIGIHPDQLSLLPEILQLNDYLYSPARFHATEQFAIGAVLANRTKLSESRDIVHHYWFEPRRNQFQRVLQQIMVIENDDDLRWRKLKPSLPRQSVKGQLRFRLLRTLEHFGFTGPDIFCVP